MGRWDGSSGSCKGLALRPCSLVCKGFSVRYFPCRLILAIVKVEIISQMASGSNACLISPRTASEGALPAVALAFWNGFSPEIHPHWSITKFKNSV